MSKKKLLEENTIRRMMRLAEIDTFSDRFFEDDAEEELPGEDPMAADAEAEELPDEMGAEELPDEMGGAVDVAEEDVVAIVDAIAKAVSDVTGVPVSTSGDAGGEEMPAEDPMAAAEDPMGGEEEPPARRYEAKHDDEDDEEPVTESDDDDADGDDDDDLVKEVARRVAARLVREAEASRSRRNESRTKRTKRPTPTRSRKATRSTKAKRRK